MTRCYAACKLLEHGPLSLREFIEITGWGRSIASARLNDLLLRGRVERRIVRGHRHYLYELVA